MKRLRRRDFLALSVLGMGGLIGVKVGGRYLVGVQAPVRALPALTHLSTRHAATITAAALAMVGPAAEAAYGAGVWDPAADVDNLMGRLAQDQRSQLAIGLTLFEEWTLGLSGFSAWSREAQRAHLARWRTSSLAVHRSIWGFLHAACCSSFSGTEAGWQVMDYPGPTRGTWTCPRSDRTLRLGPGSPMSTWKAIVIGSGAGGGPRSRQALPEVGSWGPDPRGRQTHARPGLQPAGTRDGAGAVRPVRGSRVPKMA